MAELNVQPKRKAPVWPWILLLIIIGAAAYFLIRGRAINDAAGEPATTTDTANEYRSDTLSP